MRRMLPAFVLLFIASFPLRSFAREQPLPAALLQAKTVYIQLADFIPTKKDRDRGAEASYTGPCYETLRKWGRFKVVSDPKEADLVFRISSRGQTTPQQIASGQVTGAVATSDVLTTLDVIQASSGTKLWSSSGIWVLSFSAKFIPRNLVNLLRREVEEEEKAAGKQRSGAADPATNQPPSASGPEAAAAAVGAVVLAAKGGQDSANAAPQYGPLTFNKSEGADFYIAQNDKFAPAKIADGAIEIHIEPRGFQIGYNGEQLNICLAQNPFPEVRADPDGYKASCLSGALTGAREPNSDSLLVYGGNKWSDGNSDLSDATSMKADPMRGYSHAYIVNKLDFMKAPEMTIGQFRGTLYGYIVVYKQHERSNKDIMPIRLIFE